MTMTTVTKSDAHLDALSAVQDGEPRFLGVICNGCGNEWGAPREFVTTKTSRCQRCFSYDARPWTPDDQGGPLRPAIRPVKEKLKMPKLDAAPAKAGKGSKPEAKVKTEAKVKPEAGDGVKKTSNWAAGGKLTKHHVAILRWLTEQAGPVTIAEIAAAIGRKDKYVGWDLGSSTGNDPLALVARGCVERLGEKRSLTFRITEEGRKQLAAQ